MNIQILFLFTIVVVLLELVQLPEARKHVRPWKFQRLKPRWHPFSRPSNKYRFKRRPLKYRRPKWHAPRYAPHYVSQEEPYTIEIELPKHLDAFRDHGYSKKWSKRHHGYEYQDDDEDESSDFIAGKKRVRIKLIKGVKPKLSIKIARHDNLAQPEVIDSRNVTPIVTTYRPENFLHDDVRPPIYPSQWEQSYRDDLHDTIEQRHEHVYLMNIEDWDYNAEKYKY